MLKMKIVTNNNNGTTYDIQFRLNEMFGDTVEMIDNMDMTISYKLPSYFQVLPNIDLYNLLPRVAGVGIDSISYVDGREFTYNDLIETDGNEDDNGYLDLDDADIIGGRFLNI